MPDDPRNSPTPAWVADVLQFWFAELSAAQWFKRDASVDERIGARFLAVHQVVSATPDAELLGDARSALAAVIVLDQFSRNMFRGAPAAFASDPKALAIAEAAIARGFDVGFPSERRQFFYLPFEHAEDAIRQARCVELFTPLGEEAVRWAAAHKVIIDRFGRFPHRNAILGRESTPEEIEFLRGPNSSF
jgi:uncharacterized protein (DUF924 family)